MNTFIVSAYYPDCAAALDSKRLNKQILEAAQIHRLASVPVSPESTGYRFHPAVRMWEPYLNSLALYGIACAEEFRNRTDTLHAETAYFRKVIFRKSLAIPHPPWITDEEFLLSNMRVLYLKDPLYYRKYSRFNAYTNDASRYVWPVEREYWRKDNARTLWIRKKRWVKIKLIDNDWRVTTSGTLSPPCRIGANLGRYLLLNGV